MAKRKVNVKKVVVVGGSAGSLEVLLQLLPVLQKDIGCPIVIVLHRKISNDLLLVELLSSKTKLNVMEAEEKDTLKPGWVYIAPGDYHLLFEQDGTFSLDHSEKVNYSRPSIDVAFQSAADVYESGLICVLLSGANADGTDGFRYVKSKGGVTIAQSPESAEVPFMPEQAIVAGVVDHIFDIADIADFLNRLDS